MDFFVGEEVMLSFLVDISSPKSRENNYYSKSDDEIVRNKSFVGGGKTEHPETEALSVDQMHALDITSIQSKQQ